MAIVKNSSLSFLSNWIVRHSFLRSFVVEFLVCIDLSLLVEAVFRMAIGQVVQIFGSQFINHLKRTDSDQLVELVVEKLVTLTYVEPHKMVEHLR